MDAVTILTIIAVCAVLVLFILACYWNARAD